ncbi:MAG TPA: UDP-N-acetylmuramoyl-tripeptide--D-alanyl-D-alanine ligase [Terriglobales bacterium]|nr:UDP-N-acetylmuramoyl-tripeptide--D-alanyl-D-alanine ligase [Terriglobales bacterium]
MKLPLWRVAELIESAGEFDDQAIAQGYSIDSRTIRPGELFFAIKGERFDGHDFVEAALRSGAAGAVIRRDLLAKFPGKAGLLAVSDPLRALQALAAAVRRMWGKTLIAVTGSAGKTTTKEIIAHLLSTRYQVLKSEGNLNNQYGLPLQLLKLEAHGRAVIEMGMNHAGEITELANIAKPDIGVVTLVAPVHLEFFNSVAEIARAKYELVASLPPHGTAILNADDPYVSQFGRDFHGKVVLFGLKPTADLRAENIEEQGLQGTKLELVACGARVPTLVPLVGRHNVYNALAGAAVAIENGLTLADAAKAFAGLRPADKRGQTLSLAGATVINDCYNSNPKALKSMVEALGTIPGKRRIVVAGEMLELGPTAGHLHQESGRHMAEQKIDVVIGVRGAAREIVEAARVAGVTAVQFMETPEQAGEWLAREVRPGDVVLLKASRGVKLEKALETWKAAVS